MQLQGIYVARFFFKFIALLSIFSQAHPPVKYDLTFTARLFCLVVRPRITLNRPSLTVFSVAPGIKAAG